MPAASGEAGFAASYFALSSEVATLQDVDFNAEPVASDTVESLQFLDVAKSFSPEAGADHFAVQYSTVLDVTTAGAHELFLIADDDARIFVDGEQVLETSGFEPGELATVWLDLDAGEYDVQVQYLEVEGEQSLNLDWKGPSTNEGYEPLAGAVPDHIYVPEAPETPEPIVEDETPEEPEPIVDEGRPEGPRGPRGPQEDSEDANEEPETADAKTEFAARACETDEQNLYAVNFDEEDCVETVTNGVTLASEDGALLEGGPENGAVQFTAQISVETAGLYDIGLSSDDQASVFISGLPVVYTDADDEGTEQSNSIFLISGQHNVDVRYLDEDGAQSLNVTWSGPDTDGEPLPIGDTPGGDLIDALFSDDVAARSDEEAAAIAIEEADKLEQDLQGF